MAQYAHNYKDISGQKFGRLTAIERVGKDKENRALWRCVCECGNEIIVPGKSLRSGNTKSCGCFNIDDATQRIVALNTTHGMSHTRLFKIWGRMHTRCENPNVIEWRYYGGKGISVCEEWNEFEPFYSWSIANGYSDDLTIDRIDSNKGYSPDNCRWTTLHEQAVNRRSTRFIEYNGVTLCMSDWSRVYGMSSSWLNGMSDEKARETIRKHEERSRSRRWH